MNLILKSLPMGTLRIGEPAPLDLFDSKGKLLLAKGRIVKQYTLDLLSNRKIYALEYDRKYKKNSIQNEDTKKFNQFIQRGYYYIGLIKHDLMDGPFLIVQNMISKLEKVPIDYMSFDQFRSFDEYTYNHSVNVALLGVLIGKEIGYNEEYLEYIAQSALLHDWGKIAIPHEILNKETSLSEDEYNLIKQHPVLGYDMLQDLGFPIEVLAAVRHHHERWNGKGYPDCLHQCGISDIARIVAVADVFDALMADRPYRAGLPPYHALELVLSGSGVEFAPDAVTALCRCLELYPENAVVKLNTGEVGIVIAIPQKYPTRPLVKVIFSERGEYEKTGKTIDLLYDPSRYIESVEMSLI